MTKGGFIASVAVATAELTSIYKIDYPVEGFCGEETNVEKSLTNPHWFFPMTFGNFHEGKCADIGYSKFKESRVVEMHPVPWVRHNLTFDIYDQDEEALEVDDWCQLVPYYGFCAQFNKCLCSSASCACLGASFKQQEAMDAGFSKGCSCKDSGYIYSSGKITTAFGPQADLYTNTTPAIAI
jgi:hypothetical protein